MKYVIMGDPTPLARARHGKGRTWDSQKQLKLVWGIHLKGQHQDKPLLFGPLLLDITFYMKQPKTKKNKEDKESGDYHKIKPDLSNLVKFIEDVATNILYKDDCLIAKIIATKVYDENPRTEFTLQRII